MSTFTSARAYRTKSRICDDAAEALERTGTPEALAALEKFRRENG